MSSEGSSHPSDPDIKPIWLESTIQASHKPVDPPPPPRKRRGWIWIVLLCAAAGGGWFAFHQTQQTPTAWLHQGWGAHRAGDYAQARAALEKARAKAPDLAGLKELEAAITAAPLLDRAEGALAAGKTAEATTALAEAKARAPQDPRVLRLTRRLSQAAPDSTPVTPPSAAPQSAAPATTLAVAPDSTPGSTPEAPPATPASAAPLSVAAVDLTGDPEPDSAARARPKRRRRATGGVRVMSSEPALVVVDGTISGKKLPAALQLPIGVHTIELRSPEDGVVLMTKTVRVRRGRSVAVRYQGEAPPAARPAVAGSAAPATEAPSAPESAAPEAPVTAVAVAVASAAPESVAPATAAPASTAPVSIAAAPATKAAPPRPLTGPTGFLSITSEAPAQVILNGRVTGLTTPVWMHKVPAGRHRVALRDAKGTFGRREVMIPAKQMIPVVIRRGAPK